MPPTGVWSGISCDHRRELWCAAIRRDPPRVRSSHPQGLVWNSDPRSAYNPSPLLPTALMLLALLVTALSASTSFAADSVRSAAKQGTVRPDTTLLTLPAPTIVAPAQPAPEVALPIR